MPSLSYFIFLYSEVGGRNLRNVGTSVPNWTASHPIIANPYNRCNNNLIFHSYILHKVPILGQIFLRVNCAVWHLMVTVS